MKVLAARAPPQCRKCLLADVPRMNGAAVVLGALGELTGNIPVWV